MRLLLFILLITLSNQLCGQRVKKDVVTLQTKDGDLHSGRLVKLDQDSVAIDNRTQGILSFARSEILRLVNGEVTSLDRINLSEPFYFPTALSNGKGNHHYKNYYLLGHNLSFGITDALDLSVGFELFSLVFNSDVSPILQLGTKYSLPLSDKFHLGLAGKWLFNDEGGSVLLQLPMTFGAKDNNLTISPSIAYDSTFDENMLFLSGVWSFTIINKTRLITDVMLAGEFRTANIALEFTIKDRISILPGVIWSNDPSYIPSVAFTIPFGQWK